MEPGTLGRLLSGRGMAAGRPQAVADTADLLDEGALLSLAALADRLMTDGGGIPEGPPRPLRRAGSGDEFHDHQPYAPGDDPRLIDWRATARTGQTTVRRFAQAGGGRWTVLLDASASMAHPGPETWQLARRLAAAFLYLLLNRGNRTGLLLFGGAGLLPVPPGRGRAQLGRVMSALAPAMPAPAGRGPGLADAVAHLGRGQSAIVIGDFLTPDAMAGDLRTLRAGSGAVHVLQVTAEDTAPPGPGGIRDAETGEVLPVATGDTAMATVRERRAAHTRLLRDTCTANGMAYTACAADTDWRTHMIAHLAALRPRHS